MLEVCFSDSIKCTLAVAQNCVKGIGGVPAIAVTTEKRGIFSFFAKRKALKEYKKSQMELRERAVPLGGSRKDVVGITFGLSEGDIKAPISFQSCPRKDYVYSTFSFDRYNQGPDMDGEINEVWQQSMIDLEKVKAMPKKVRIWLDHTPDAQCGLLFIADLLKESDTEIHIVELPKRIKRDDNCEIEYRGWGEVEPQLFGTFLDRERIISQNEKENLANRWQILTSENAPLRVVENGVVVSAKESYYDHLIRKEFPKERCKVAKIIGNALGEQKIPTGDVFVAKRIQSFIESGELEVIENTSEGFYGTVVQFDDLVSTLP